MGWASPGGWEGWAGQSCCLWEGLAATSAVSGGTSLWPMAPLVEVRLLQARETEQEHEIPWH